MNSVPCWKFLEVGWGDLEFPTALFPCQTSIGESVNRWMPYGMPTISPFLAKTVLYMYGRDPQTGEWGLGGSGFVVGLGSPFEELIHAYAVTNWHVAVDRGFSAFRTFGQRDDSFIELDVSEWEFLPNSDDLAIADITSYIDQRRDQIRLVSENMLMEREEAERSQVGFGDDVFMIGMFANSPGEQRNAPVARFGNIARIPTDDALIELETGAKTACYLVDMRSRTGFSGSPVFVYRTVTSDLREIIMGEQRVTIDSRNRMFLLLGIHCGQYPERIEVLKSEALGRSIVEGDHLKSPSAMNVVVPAWRILDLLNCPRFKRIREMREANRKDNGRDRPRPESILELPTKDENSRHREDFNSLLDAAVKGPQSGDQT